MRLKTVNGSIACKAGGDWLHLGKKMVGDLIVLNCQSALVKPQARLLSRLNETLVSTAGRGC